MPDRSPNLDMPFLMPSQAQKHVTHNEALQHLDALVQLRVGAFGASLPPAAPEHGDCYALGAGASGDWAGQDGSLAYWDGTGWLFLTPVAGWRAWGQTEGEMRVYDDGDWRTPGHLGVNTNADTTNRLAVASDATLLTHDGAGHQVKVNKSSSADTASLVFQSNWSGRAEMGLAGQDNWSIKVSPDGAGWTEALTIDATTGVASGAAVQATPQDTTPGRLMRADYGYGPGNILSTVGQSAGTPTGGVMERGSNANGEYIKFADGTVECWSALNLTYVIPSKLAALWTYPVALINGVIVPNALLNVSSYNAGATPPINDLTGVYAGAIDVGSCYFQLFRNTGAADFLAGDQAQVRVRVLGRWF